MFQVLPLPLTGPVILGKFHILSMPQTLHQENGLLVLE